LFDFLSGQRSRAPGALQAAGLEWAYRMALEPKRLGWRYATTNVTAALAMARSARGGVN
jgi:UDP-N-acetyl-D-mannosaminuronic acid transferase (WecB/TagA/CpsF family)